MGHLLTVVLAAERAPARFSLLLGFIVEPPLESYNVRLVVLRRRVLVLAARTLVLSKRIAPVLE
jgi:hypothetical protein